MKGIIMQNGWTLAETQPVGQDGIEIIKAEDISSQNQQGAQTTTQQADPNTVPATGKKLPANQWSQLIFLVLILAVLYIVMFRSPKKRQQEQRQMVQSLKKNDRVQTVGGILGTIIEVGDNEITLKIDESNNTKMKVLPSAISKVVG
jgi:preprotein translocase subunit YajC